MNPVHDLKFYNILRHDNLDIIHVLHSWLPEYIPRNIKVAITIHDIFSVIDPDFFAKHKPFDGLYRIYFKYLTARSVKRADAIITVSKYTKDQLIKYFDNARKKIHVVPNASGLTSRGSLHRQNESIVNGDYLLFVGNCRSYKNVDTLVDGFYIFINNSKLDVKLVIAGNDPCDSIKEKVNTLNISEKVIFLSRPTDDELSNLYTHAIAAIAPSKYEGFGIPVLEAMEFGIPVITSDAEAFVELAGNAAKIFNRNNPQELARAIEQVVMNEDLRDELITKGRERVKRFSWEASARELLNLYQALS